jgi:Fe-S oxidoreductase/nitrate reductase gamma subunit
MGKAWKRGDLRRGLGRFLVAAATHRKFQQDAKPGTMHALIFYGFVALFITTTIVMIDADFFELVLNEKLLQGRGYLLLEAFADTFGVLFVVALVAVLWRRYVERPKQLHETKAHEAPWLRWMSADAYALVFLLAVGVTGFFLEAIRIQHQVQVDGITHSAWSYVGNALAGLFAGASPAALTAMYVPLWWTHFILWTSILAILPWTKLRHILTSSLNIILLDPDRQARPELSTPFDLKAVMASTDADMPDVGVTTIRDFTWKDRLAFDACTNCGRCEAQCPATAAGRPLSPRKLIQDLKAQMWEDYRASRRDKSHAPAPLTDDAALGEAISETTLWSCTTCRACVTECPVDINHVDLIVDMRRALVNRSRLDENQQKLIVNVANAGNPYGFPASDRDAWTQTLPGGVVVRRAEDVVAARHRDAAAHSMDSATAHESGDPDPAHDTPGAHDARKPADSPDSPPFEYLWWIGCSGSFDPRNQEVTRALARIWNAAGLDFAILGNAERCTGDPVRRLGEEGRFQQSVLENLTVLNALGVRKVITQCPHCFNTLANEYPKFGADWEVMHHAQLLERLLDEGRVPLVAGKQIEVSYHDSCYLGRHNGIFDAPRRVIAKANGLPVLEMAQSREQGLCCGAGGANMWYEIADEAQRINVIRAKQAAATGATTVATACPFCLTMMKDGLGLTGNDVESGGRMVAKDLAEIVAEHLDWTPPESAAAQQPDAAGAAAGAESPWIG